VGNTTNRPGGATIRVVVHVICVPGARACACATEEVKGGKRPGGDASARAKETSTVRYHDDFIRIHERRCVWSHLT